MRQIGHHPECPENIVRVSWPLLRDDALEDDFSGFLDGKFGAFDEVGEIGFEKGKRRTGLAAALGREPTPDIRVAQSREQGLEQADAVRIEGLAGVTRLADRAGEIAIAGAEQAADQLVKLVGFRFIAQFRRDRFGIVTQSVDRALPLLTDQRIEAPFELVA